MTLAEPLPPTLTPFAPPVLERVRGAARIGMRNDGGMIRLTENFQSGSAKARFPKPVEGGPLEVVLLNTAGGVTGGDRLSYAVSVGAGARGVATTQAAERIYRRNDGFARIETTLTVAEGGALDWVPQETILFDNSALTRSLTADVAMNGRLLAVESILFGRAAMGERAHSIALSDSWRIRRGGKIVFADGLRLHGDSVEILVNGATANGNTAVATLVVVAPDAEAMLDRAREALASAIGEAGASAWNGMLVARLTAPGGQALRADLIPLIEALRGVTMPRVWHC